MINSGMMSSETDLWETPQDFFDKLNEEFNFELDVCALPENAKCVEFYTPKDDSLSQVWRGGLLDESPLRKTNRYMDQKSV